MQEPSTTLPHARRQANLNFDAVTWQLIERMAPHKRGYALFLAQLVHAEAARRETRLMYANAQKPPADE